MPKPCGVPTSRGECDEPKNRAMGDGYCTSHSYEWRRSEAFQEAARDESVRFAAGLRVPSLLNRVLRPFKKRWLKRVAAAFAKDEP